MPRPRQPSPGPSQSYVIGSTARYEPPRKLESRPIVTLRSDNCPLAIEKPAFVERVTRSTTLVHDHAGLEKCVSDLRKCRAAYRNRTDDLRITRRI
jgi:hypothetical protein